MSRPHYVRENTGPFMGYCKPGGVILGSRKIDSPHEKPGWGEKRERERKKGIGRDGASFRSLEANEPTALQLLPPES